MTAVAARQTSPADRAGAAAKWTLVIVCVVFAAALLTRARIVRTDHVEGDELIYRAFVQQLEDGRGYTLQGSPILDNPAIPKDQYDRPLFYHPPGGMVLFWIFHRLFGESGFALAQLASFAVFFWAMIALARLVIPCWGPAPGGVAALLAGFTPIVAHVNMRYWLDGPQVAFATLGSALFLAGIARRGLGLPVAAGVLLAWACLTKLNAVLVFPGFLGVALAVRPPAVDVRRVARTWAITVVLAVALTIPWIVVQWTVYGVPFPTWAGKPSAALIASNTFVRKVTVDRSAWTYVRLLPQTVWTLGPSCLLLALQWGRTRVRRTGLALLFWIAIVVAVNTALGFIGYSKLLRYVILLTPATILLFASTAGQTLDDLRAGRPLPGGPALSRVLLVVAALALALEVFHGIRTTLYPPRLAIIPPLVGRIR